ncbi:MAG: CorA family divalent cation transporter, partial [Actinomycetota bacterium]
MSTRWIDLLDPTPEELMAALPSGADPDVLETLTAPSGNEHTRPLLESHGAYVLGVFLDGQPLPDDDRIVYREVDLLATPHLFVTVRKTPEAGTPWDPAPLELAAARGVSVGELLFRLVDDVAASFFDVVVALDAQIDELEDHIDDWPSELVRRRIGGLRHDLLHARRTVGAMRGAVRRIVDKRLDIGDERLFPETVERMVANTYETLIGAGEELEVARELLSSVRDYHQSVITEKQNDIIKTLTVIASLVLVPTLIVGFYGQNFARDFDEGYWSLAASTALIVA